MAITKQEIADAFGLSVQRLDDIFGTGNRVEVNKKVGIIATEALEKARSSSESLLFEEKQRISDTQAKLAERYASHEVAFLSLSKIIEDSKSNMFTEETFPDISSLTDLIK